MATFYAFTVVVLLCVTGFDCKVRQDSEGKLIFSNSSDKHVVSTLNTEFDGKGLKPWYDLAKSFIHTVQKDDPPYGDLKLNSDNEHITKFLKGWELPFLVTFAIGFLFALILPIVGLCFCCCRCCGNCGGEMVQKENDHSSKKCAIFSIILTIITLLMFTGCLLAFVSNDRLTDTVKSFQTTPINAIKDTEKYFNQTLHVVTDSVIDDVLDVLTFVSKDVEKLPSDIIDVVKTSLTSSVENPLNSVVKLGNDTRKMKLLLQNVTSKTNDLKNRSRELTADLNNISSSLKAICTTGANCTGINFNNSLKPEANFDSLPNVTNQLDNVNNVVDNNKLAENAKKGLEEFDEIYDKISKEVKKNTGSINVQISNATDTFKKKIKDDISDRVKKEILNKTDDWIKEINDLFDDQVKPYDNYRYQAGIGIICLILIPVVLMALGLLCGICGYKKERGPTDRGSISHIGGNCLMAAVGFMFIFVFILMLFTSISFIVGAHLEKGCSTVRDETIYSKFIDDPKYWNDKYIIAEKVLENGSIDLSFESILRSCRKNDPFFKAIRGNLRWNLREKFDVKKELGNFENDINNISIPVGDQNIFDNNTANGLRNLSDSGVDQINFTKFFEETNKNVVNNLTGLVNKLREKNIASLDTIADDVANISKKADEMEVLSKSLQKDVKDLQKLGGNIKFEANEILTNSTKASSTFKADADRVIKDAVKKFSDQIFGYISAITNRSVDVIEGQLGKCKILADIYDATVNLLCSETVFPFNGFWFSIGFCLFFYIPAMIFSVKLAKHYRRMKFEEGFDRHDVHEMTQFERNKPWLNQGNAVYPK